MVAKKFAIQVSLLIVVNLIVKLIWIFFIERKIQLLVGFENYGLYYSIFNFTLILSIINDPGLTNYLIRFIASKSENSSQIASLFSIKILLSICYLLLTLLLSSISGYTNYQLVLILIGYQILWSFLIYLRGFLKGHQFLNAEVFFSILDKFLLIITLIP
ncbi:MAG: oligosaccharide flippase family protein, partial [Oligoflexus sp.]|nr:oligosaccharide flippase family protein [Pseudopedobacter sp.]